MFNAGDSKSVLQALLICLDDLDSWTYDKMMQTLSARSAYGIYSTLRHYQPLHCHCTSILWILFEALLSATQSVAPSDSQSLSQDQMRDINLFNAFHIIDCMLDAMQISVTGQHHHSRR